MLMESDKTWAVQFSGSAHEDLVGIIQFLLENESVEFARELSELIRKEGEEWLKAFPLRGRIVPELESVTSKYREIRVKSYRLIYRPIAEQQTVRILVVAHVKRNIQDMLISKILI